MFTRSAAYDAAVVAGAVPVVTATASYGGTVLKTGLPILPGADITVDSGAAIRRTLRCHLADNTGALVPTGPTAALAPFGSELAVSVGFIGVADTVPVGVFRIDDMVADSTGLIAIAASDRASAVAACVFEDPYTITVGTNLVAAITSILTAQYPGTLTTNFMSSAAVALAPVTYKEGDDPWAACQALAASMGMELFFDVTGVCTLRPVLDPTSKTAVWTYAPGPGSLLLKVTTRMSSRGVRNVALVIGEGTGVAAPARAKAAVSDPNTAVYPSAAFGRRTDVTISSVIGTVPAAQTAANARLLQIAGGGELLQFSAVPHPAHDAGDLVRVTYAPLGVDALVVLSHFGFAIGLDKEVVYDSSGKRAA